MPYIQYVAAFVPILVISVALLAHWLGPKNSNFDTISKHVSNHRGLFYLMAITITLLAIPYYSYIALWLIPFYELSAVTYIILIISYISLLLTVWVPAKPGRHYIIHTASATFVAFSMLFIGAALSMAGDMDAAGRLASISFVILSLSLIVNGVLKFRLLNKLYTEALFIVTFYVMTVVATFL